MKKLPFCILFFLTIYQISFGQKKTDGTNKKLKVGINLGPNYNTISSYTTNYDIKRRFDFSGGIIFEYEIIKNFSILTNLNYINKNIKTEYIGFTSGFPFGVNTNTIVTDNIKFKYIQIPLLTRLYLGNKNPFFFNGGVFYNYLLKGSNEFIIEETNEFVAEIDFEELSNPFKSNDFGISFGAGFKYKLNDKQDLLIELRNNIGISDIKNNLNNSTSSIKTNTLNFIIAWEFGI